MAKFKTNSNKSPSWLIYLLTALSSLGISGLIFWVGSGMVFTQALSEAFFLGVLHGVNLLDLLAPFLFSAPAIVGGVLIGLIGVGIGYGFVALEVHLNKGPSPVKVQPIESSLTNKDELTKDASEAKEESTPSWLTVFGLSSTALLSAASGVLLGFYASNVVMIVATHVASALGMISAVLFAPLISAIIGVSTLLGPAALAIVGAGLAFGGLSAGLIHWWTSEEDHDERIESVQEKVQVDSAVHLQKLGPSQTVGVVIEPQRAVKSIFEEIQPKKPSITEERSLLATAPL
ncbi:hypothetical protein [Legionella waltersii]|uniref:Transmembrane protein n=1 Tax=Legionella waltersii TaxID=66969 RepID=A0A0W1AJ98_9GAMM|nr:hypothetical protein [Legionella waltersii]KTD81348.1 hypothetical protein Lwal_1057 [Legionella waltersii]SNV02728.1 Uncharacterised protein [Legionella waltersii]